MIEYSMAVKQTAFEYYAKGLSFAEIAESFNHRPDVRTIRRWAKTLEWESQLKKKQTAPLQIDNGLIAALAMELPGLESPDPKRRKEAIDNCFKIAATRSKLGTNEVDRGPIAIELMEKFKSHAQRRLSELLPAELRPAARKALAALILEFFEIVVRRTPEVIG